MRPPIGFVQSLDLEHPVSEVEPLSFILSRLLNQLCANLNEYALATNELKLQVQLENQSQYECAITLPVPMRNPRTLLRLLLFEIEKQPPDASIMAVTISGQPVAPQALQTGLFTPLTPEPEKLEITLARLSKLVGAGNVGSPELLDTHRPDAFRLKRFCLPGGRKTARAKPPTEINKPQCVMALRVFRPPRPAQVQTINGQPARIDLRPKLRGKIICAAGPWRTSGDWWRPDGWARDEWDVAVIDPSSPDSEVLCRIYRDLQSEEWFVAGIYD